MVFGGPPKKGRVLYRAILEPNANGYLKESIQLAVPKKIRTICAVSAFVYEGGKHPTAKCPADGIKRRPRDGRDPPPTAQYLIARVTRHRATRIATMRIAVSRAPGAERVVTPLELFFDLVYVFAIGQLSHHLLEHVDLRTGAETVIMALAVIYAWYMVAWGANWLDPDRLPVRLLLVGLMFASLLMSVAIADAFDGRAWLFVTGYLLLQIGRSGFLIVALRGRPHGEHFVNDLVWEVLTGCLWVAGAIADGDARLVLWGLAVAATYAGVTSIHWLPGRGRRLDLGHTDIAGEHLIERFRLFFIIALGETVLTMGAAFTDEPFELQRLLALAIGFTGTVALWWCYFQRAERIGVEVVETAEDAGAVGWWGTVTLTMIVLALIGIAVGDELAIAHPGDDATSGLHDPHVRRAGAVRARPGRLHARSGRAGPALPAAGPGGARDPRGRHRAAHDDRRDRRVERRARLLGGHGHGRHESHDGPVKAIAYRRYGAPDLLRLEEVPRPEVKRDDDVLVKVHATSINSWDWDLLSGTPFTRLVAPRRPSHPVLGADVAGVVEAVGEGVTRFRPGDAVFGDLSGCGWGGLGEYACARERALAAMPRDLTFEQAAAVPQAGVLALQGLRYGGPMGDEVLINGAGGGVGTFAVQLAKAAGARVTGVDSAGKLDLLRSLGADDVIDYRDERFADRRGRYDRIVDVVLRGSIVTRSRALRPGGVYGVIGGSLPRILQTAVVGPMLRGRKVGVVIHRPGREPLEALTEALEAGTIAPVIDSTFGLADAAKAFERFGTGEFRGKVVITQVSGA